MERGSHKSLENLRKEFAAILKLYNDIVAKKTAMDTKISGIKEVYNGLVKTHSTRTFLFCLDSLFFQYKILNLELEHYNKKIALLQNRMYGDYYKLYLLILTHTKDVTGIVLSSSGREPKQEFPVYKDIDPFYKYKLDDIIAIHDRILSILGELYGICEEKTANITHHRDSIAVGASLLIFINTMEHERDGLLTHIQLFSRYMGFYHQSQARYLDNLYREMVDFYANLEDSVLVCLDGASGEAIAEPYTDSYEDSNNNNTNTILMENIYDHDENLPPILYESSPKSAFDLDKDINPEQSPSNHEEAEGPLLDLQMLGSQYLNEIHHTSSTETIVYMAPQEPTEPTEPTEPDYITQNITMEICDDEVVNEEVNLEVESREPTSQDSENISII